MTAEFEPVSTPNPVLGLFLLSAGGPKTYFYYVQHEPPEPRPGITLVESWRGPSNVNETDTPGWYVFVEERVVDAAKFAERVREELPEVSRLNNGLTRRCISWIPNVNQWVGGKSEAAPPYSLMVDQYSWQFPDSRSVVAPGHEFTWSDNLRLKVPGGTRVDCVSDGAPRFEFTPSRLDLKNCNGTLTGAFPPPGGPRLAVPLTSEQAGSFAFRVRWDPAVLRRSYQCGFRYVVGGGGDAPRNVDFPLLLLAPGGADLDRSWGCDMWLHPFYPEDSNCTRLLLDLSRNDDAARRSKKLVSPYFLTTTGSAAGLRPKPPLELDSPDEGTKLTFDASSPGFALVKGPAPVGVDEADAWHYAMAPVGRFVLEGGNGQAPAQLMCGLTSTEYVLLQPGDEIEFVPGQPAFAPAFPGASGLTDRFTTSWARVHKTGTTDRGDGEVATSYCVQPSTASFFARSEGSQPDDFLEAVGISLASLGETVLNQNQNPIFPLLPYGGVFGGLDNGKVNPNRKFDAKTVAAFENQVVEPTRRARLKGSFSETGPVFFDAAKNNAFDGGFARTPMGFVAELNRSGESSQAPAGSWHSLKMARSPQDPTQYLELLPDKAGVVNPTFSYAALRDNLFMVVTNPALLWSGESPGKEIKLGDFTFVVDIDTFDEATDKTLPKALVVFKFVPGVSFTDLVSDTEAWTSFFGAGDDVVKVKSQIETYLRAAREGDEDLYDAFLALVDDPNWTGVLVFNCPLDYQALPPDIQIILGGIDGTLRAHHFGVTINRVENEEAGATMSMQDSSLFAVIDYKKNFVTPERHPDFQVLLFNVEYANSKLVVFNSRIAFSLNELFGNPAALSKAPEADNEKLFPVKVDPQPHGDVKETGTIVIDGVYTLREDGTGSLVFSADEQRVFGFPVDAGKLRVLQGLSVDDATLVPVESTEQDGVVTAIASFRLDGTLALKDDIGGDLFSYGKLDQEGVPSEGLVIIDYGFAMTTDIPKRDKDGKDKNGKVVAAAQLRPIQHDLGAMKVDQALSKSRDNSFEKTFPSNIEAVRYVTEGQGTLQTGAWQVYNEGLEEIAPNYALHFKVPLGSLGGLVSSTNHITADLHIGWVSGGSADVDDTVGAVLVLPAIVAGPDGISIQGIIATNFESVHLDRQEFDPSTSDGKTVYAYNLRFRHFSLSLIGIPLSYGMAPKDLGIFGSPNDPGGDNALWFVGKSVKPSKKPEGSIEVTDDLTLWAKGPELDSSLFFEPPFVFIGRSFAIQTDPTNPKVIDLAIKELRELHQGLREQTIAGFMELLYANSEKYSSAAGMTFAVKFEFLGLDLGVLLHDSDFYGAKIKLSFDLSKKKKDDKKPDDKKPDDKKPDDTKQVNKQSENSEPLVASVASRQAKESDEKSKADGAQEKKKGLEKLKGFEFSIIYRKISENLGVWSSTIFIDVGTIEIGSGSLTLPDFSISIWTNGDWRFSVGWPIKDHPITVQFMVGPVPVIAKLGFYLAKLSSEAAPSKFVVMEGDPLPYPPNFKLIWAFGLGLRAGIGKEWKKGPLSAKASSTHQVTAEGFLASHSGAISDDGVDYFWVCVTLSAIGEVEGKADFKIISASISITLSLRLALAIESHHSATVAITFHCTVKASIKIVFVTISFSFNATLTLLSVSLGSGPPAQMDGPSPKKVKDKLPKPPAAAQSAAAAMPLKSPVPAQVARGAAARAQRPRVTSVAPRSEKIPVEVTFLLQSTAVLQSTTTWNPQGVATLVVENGGTDSPFGKLAAGLADWLISTFARDATGFGGQLEEVEAALDRGEFDTQIEACLSSQFEFTIAAASVPEDPENPPPVAVIPVHPFLGIRYNGDSISFGSTKVPADYGDRVKDYFDQNSASPQAATAEDSGESVTSLVFDEYFEMFAKQLVTELQREVERQEDERKQKAEEKQEDADEGSGTQAEGEAEPEAEEPIDLATALTEEVLRNVSGFVSRFLMGGIRLPDPDRPAELTALYKLTCQQFPLQKEPDNQWVRSADLIAASGGLPTWIRIDGDVSASLEQQQVYATEIEPDVPWKLSATLPVSPVPIRFPMNGGLEWTERDKEKPSTIFKFSDGLRLDLEKWRSDPENLAKRGPFLKLETVTRTTQAQAASTPYTASGALVVPLSVKTIPKPDGKPGEVLEDTYSLVGTDEVHRIYLQTLLEDADVMNNPGLISSLDLAVNSGQGKYKSTPPPKVLVRTNLSTSTAPGGGLAAAALAVADANAAGGAGHFCANHAKPVEGGAELAKFLRLVWECSIVHTGGFYLQVEGLKEENFKNGQASLQLVVRTSAEADTIETESFHNALIGTAPEPKHAVIANLNDGDGQPVVTYAASYPAGCASWSIEWSDPTTELNATGDAKDVLQWLYQMVSYRVTKMDGVAKDLNWSRPITALHDNGAWKYQQSFPAASLLGEHQNTYAAVGKTVEVEMSIEDIFGNSISAPPVPPLKVVYNDDILDLANWSVTQTDYKITESSKADKARLAVNFSYGSLLFSLGDFTDIKALATKITDRVDEVSKFIWNEWSRIAPETQAVLGDSESPPEDVQVALIEGLNKLIRSENSIFESARFAAVNLRPQTRDLTGKQLPRNQTIFLNRLLLEDAFSDLVQAEVGETTDEEQLRRALEQYVMINNQLHDPNLSAAINTGSLLAPDTPPTGAAPEGALTDVESGDPVVKGLQDFVGGVVAWLQWLIDGKPKPEANVPAPVTLEFELDKDYPLNWDGDLRELRVDLLLRRDGVDGAIAAKAPEVQSTSSPITPVMGKSTADDPTGLSAFAVDFEKAYYQFDGKEDGVIKVATGANSDPKSSRFGMQTLWLARWGAESGITVKILNDKDNKPVYYAPPPLSTQLITRKVKGLRKYSGLDLTPEDASQVFSAIDIDSWAASFLSSVENIFSPLIAPRVAQRSTPGSELYDPYVAGKTKLAADIASTLAFIYDYPQDVGDPPQDVGDPPQDVGDPPQDVGDPDSAQFTMYQALLNTLENDYGISTLVQMAAMIGLHGSIEPAGDPDNPPNVYGSIEAFGPTARGADHDSGPLPYSMSPAKLPLKEGKAWLNFLLSVQNPAAQSALTLELAYQMGFVEHKIDAAATRCGYTPSNWLSFVRQQNQEPLPKGKQNTLTAPMDILRMPIPLRSYPPLPKLIAAKATQDIPPAEVLSIEQALVWTYSLTVALPPAAQDTLNLMVTFNEPPGGGSPGAVRPAAAAATTELAARSAPADLFEGLARYVYEYPQLAPHINKLAAGVTDVSTTPALTHFSELVNGIAEKWRHWKPPARPEPSPSQTEREVWHYSIDHQSDGTLTVKAPVAKADASANRGSSHWPVIQGYPEPEISGNTATYKLESPESSMPASLVLSWSKLFVLDYQSARASAFVERNRNLGGETGETTNEAFVYRTETVKMPSSVVPLIRVPNRLVIRVPERLKLPAWPSLEAAVTSILETMHQKPEGAVGPEESKSRLKLEGTISYSFVLLDNLNASVKSFLPLFLMENDIAAGENTDAAAAKKVTETINKWREQARPNYAQSSISFRLTIFATKIVMDEDEQLPLVQFHDLSIEARDPRDDGDWW